MGIPEGQQKYTDLVDIVISSSSKTVDVPQKDGSVTKEQIIDEDTLWWKTLSVSANTLGRMAFELKEWERTAFLAFNNMCRERAKQIAEEIVEVGTSYRRSIDSKSSESQRDKDNSQSTLIDKINRNKIEKVYTAKGEAKRSMLEGFLGRDREREEEND